MIHQDGISITFHLICVVVTFSMLMYCTLKFTWDESTSIVDFQVYHNREVDIYPSISFCFTMDSPEEKWYNSNLKLYKEAEMKDKFNIDDIEKQKDYVRFLLGEDSNADSGIGIAEFIAVDYDEVTIDLKDYLKTVKVLSKVGTTVKWQATDDTPMPFYISYRHPFTKCFTFDVSDTLISNEKGNTLDAVIIEMYNNNEVFNASSELVIGYYLHYPKQLMRAKVLEFDQLGRASKAWKKVFPVNTLEVIRRRNTHPTPCIEEYKKEDDLILKELIKKVGCNSPIWPVDKEYPRCTTKEQMCKLYTPSLRSMDLDFLDNFIPACNQVQSVIYTFKDLIGKPPPKPPGKIPPPNHPGNASIVEEDKSNFTSKPTQEGSGKPSIDDTKSIDFVYKSPIYKEIQHIQAFNIESYIGNVGGYVGLFLGVALWKAPDLIGFLLGKLNHFLNRRPLSLKTNQHDTIYVKPY